MCDECNDELQDLIISSTILISFGVLQLLFAAYFVAVM